MSDAVEAPPPPDQDLVNEEPNVPTRRLLLFNVARGSFACDMDAFREIVPPPQMTRLPGASDAVCGLINLRGTIVTVIDGGRALDLQPFVRDEGLILIVDYFDRWIGIGVDDVRDIQDVPIDQFVSTDGSELPVPGVVTAVVELEGKRVIVLDIKTVIQQVIGQGR
ncbi:MAG TPA: chemotaxis protein CheW [Gemmatimonadaceae bacterium]|nr:chemotaxis protein CheW [Gemmatimonadaceae bacterium]